MSDLFERLTLTRLGGLRSLLFAPGDDEHKLRRALTSDADAVIADLEDAVAPSRKEAARVLVERVFAGQPSGAARLVRINGAHTTFFGGDLDLVGRLDLDGVVLPKAAPDAVAAMGDSGPPVVAIVETARGLQQSERTASLPRVERFALGAADLGRELGLEPRRDELEILLARSKLVLDSAAAGLAAPIDVVHLALREPDILVRSARRARSLGFGGKLCIHPEQVPLVNQVFAPTQVELDWARRVVDAYEEAAREGRGVVALDGQMVDAPVVARASRTLSMARSGWRSR